MEKLEGLWYNDVVRNFVFCAEWIFGCKAEEGDWYGIR